MSHYAIVHLQNHGLDSTNVSHAFSYENGVLVKLSADKIMKKSYGDWTIIAKIIDSDNFECFSGEIEILNLASNLHFEKPWYEGDLDARAQNNKHGD